MQETSSIPGTGRSSGEENCNPLQYACLGNPMDRGAWLAIVHGVVKSQIWLSDYLFFLNNKASKWKLLSWSIIPASDRPTVIWIDLDQSRIPNLYLEVVLFLHSLPCSLSHPSIHCICLIYPSIYSRNSHSTLMCWARDTAYVLIQRKESVSPSHCNRRDTDRSVIIA